MKITDRFKEIIKAHLDDYAKEDPLFELNYKNENKSIDECCQYILGQVKKSGMNGFADDEIFQMAIHYYDEAEIKVENMGNCKIIINHKIELTPEEIEEEKKKAKEKIFQEERNRLTSKPKKATPNPIQHASVNTENVETKPTPQQSSLF